MLQAVTEHSGSMHHIRILAWQQLHPYGVTIRPDAIPLLQHLRHVLHQQLLGCRHEAFDYLLSVLRNHIYNNVYPFIVLLSLENQLHWRIVVHLIKKLRQSVDDRLQVCTRSNP